MISSMASSTTDSVRDETPVEGTDDLGGASFEGGSLTTISLPSGAAAVDPDPDATPTSLFFAASLSSFTFAFFAALGAFFTSSPAPTAPGSLTLTAPAIVPVADATTFVSNVGGSVKTSSARATTSFPPPSNANFLAFSSSLFLIFLSTFSLFRARFDFSGATTDAAAPVPPTA